MNIKPITVLLTIALTASAGCTAEQKEHPGLSAPGAVHVIAREDGSGTREQFESSLHLSSEAVFTTASSSEEMTELVENDPSAIGYIAMNALEEDADVRVIAVDDIAHSIETIQNGTYPLTRSYYLAWADPQSDLEQEFITYAAGAGQAYVSKEAVSVSEVKTFLSLKPEGTLKITGSTSIYSLMQKIADGYRTYNPCAEITVEETDSSEGLNAVISH